MKVQCLTFSLLVLLFTACKDTPEPLPEAAKTAIIPLIHHEAYIVTVDNLRMRQQPGRTTEVLRKMPEGSILLSDGTVSDFTDKITLRGKAYEEPYLKVYLRNKEEQLGWVYRGALLKIYHDDTAYPFSNNLDGLVLQVLGKDYKNLSQLERLLAAIIAESSDIREWNDALLRLAEHAMDEASRSASILQQITTQKWTAQDYQQVAGRTYDYQQTLVGKQLANAAMLLETTEGSIQPIVDLPRIAKILGGPFSIDVQDYVDIRSQVLQQQIIHDASIVVPLPRLVDLYAMLDRYLQRHDEHSLYYSDVRSMSLRYASYIRSGSDNTPVDEQLELAWRYLQDEYPDTRLAGELAAQSQVSPSS